MATSKDVKGLVECWDQGNPLLASLQKAFKKTFYYPSERIVLRPGGKRQPLILI